MAATKTARSAPKKANKTPAAKPAASSKPAKAAKPAKMAKAKAKPAAKAAVAPVRKTTAIAEKYTKSQILDELATNTGLSRRQVAGVLDELGSVIERHVKKRAAGEFTLPGLFKIKTVEKPARKARKGINPFTKAETVFKARPRSTAVKILALKALKDMVK